MKYIKKYEKNIDEIEIDDYVLLHYKFSDLSEIGIFLRTVPGKVRSIMGDTVCIEYGYSVPDGVGEYLDKAGWGMYMMFVKADKIIFNSPNKSDVEAYVASKKYNL